eukprot:COSAG01_NODE_5734_length_4069_cov_1.738539_2_plen_173_part_00
MRAARAPLASERSRPTSPEFMASCLCLVSRSRCFSRSSSARCTSPTCPKTVEHRGQRERERGRAGRQAGRQAGRREIVNLGGPPGGGRWGAARRVPFGAASAFEPSALSPPRASTTEEEMGVGGCGYLLQSSNRRAWCRRFGTQPGHCWAVATLRAGGLAAWLLGRLPLPLL